MNKIISAITINCLVFFSYLTIQHFEDNAILISEGAPSDFIEIHDWEFLLHLQDLATLPLALVFITFSLPHLHRLLENWQRNKSQGSQI